MEIIFPDYYRKFRCTGGNCPDTCCAGWNIRIDPESLKRYRDMKGPFGARLRNEIDWENRCFRQYRGKCALLNEDGLCDLYLEGGGERALCRACHIFPRHVEEFQGVREYSLSLSCPEAAELILGIREPVRFLHIQRSGKRERYARFDSGLYRVLLDARRLMFRILQNREQPWKVRAAAVLALGHDLQQRIDRNARDASEILFCRYSSPKIWPWFEEHLRGRKDGCREEKNRIRKDFFSLLKHLRPLRADWRTYLQAAEINFYQEETAEEKCGMERLFTEKTAEQLMVYFLSVYFCGAVYDGNAWGKVKFSLASTLLIRGLLRSEWRQNSGQLPANAAAMTACRYARETEHLDENLEKMERQLGDERKFPAKAFLAVL